MTQTRRAFFWFLVVVLGAVCAVMASGNPAPSPPEGEFTPQTVAPAVIYQEDP